MEQTTTLIIGAGHAGLAMSRALSLRSIDHILLDRGGPGNAWRTERWNSLRMLTPNWANSLPGANQHVQDPDGYMSCADFAQGLENYANSISAPLREGVTARRLMRWSGEFRVETDQGIYSAETVVNATGATTRAKVPALAADVPKHIQQVTAQAYRTPSDLPDGDVLVVGASASGVQIARELQMSGRQVILATGNHVRLPRMYRGRDIEHWLHRTGVYDERAQDIEDLERARRLPSAQLFSDGEIDLNSLQALGIEVVGRLSAIRDGNALFSGGLANLTTSADLKMARLLDRIDAWISAYAEPGMIASTDRPAPTAIPVSPRLSLDLSPGDLRTIVWATGYAPDTSWIDLPVFDRRNRLQHERGICPVPGLFMLGLPVMRRRRSHHVSGAAADTHELSDILQQHLHARRAA